MRLIYGLTGTDCHPTMLTYLNSHPLSPATIEFAGALACPNGPANEARSDRVHAFARRCAS
jgi:hypothetical protein